MGKQLNDFRVDTDRVMDAHYEEKFRKEPKPVANVEYTKGPTIFRTPTEGEAIEDDVAKRIREGVASLEQ